MFRFKITPFSSENRAQFFHINIEWLTEYFSVTEEDKNQLSNPEFILQSGGSVIYIENENEIIGTCALQRISDDTIELIKMGVKSAFRGQGAGDFLMKEAEKEARRMGGKILMLETAEVLKAAISLYEKHGFKRSGEEYIHHLFGRKVFKMIKLLV